MDIKFKQVQDFFEELRGPHLVARFQKACGVHVKFSESPIPVSEESESLTTTKHKHNGATATHPDRKATYSVEHKWLHYLFLFGTSLGDEIFYSIFFTMWFWSVDGAVGRRVVLVWAICMYIGQCLKDIIKWPRPSSPPVVKMETKWALEYGMPSTHAIVGSAVPLTIIYFTSSRYQYSPWIGIAVAVTLCTLVCLSRLYLGMHSVLDIIAGLSLVAVLLPVVIPLVDKLDSFFFTHETGGFTLMALGMCICLCYPSTDRWTPARGDTFVIVGSAVGLNVGCWLNYQLGIIHGPPPSSLSPPYAVMWPTGNMIVLAIFRQILGLVMVVIARVVGKKMMTAVHAKIHLPEEKLLMSEQKRPGIVMELFTKFFAYVIVGFTVTHFATIVFRALSIERPSFHTEI